jgi:hypothetical protein
MPADMSHTPIQDATSQDFTPGATPTPGTMPTATETGLQNTKWSMYQIGLGVAFEYPSEWKTVSKDSDWVLFSAQKDLVRVAVDHLAPENSVLMNPPDAQGTNEGGYEVLWEKPISTDNAKGLEFIWGQSLDNRLDGHRFLYAIYYSEQYELQVTMSMEADIISVHSDKFNIFERMVQSARIGP